MIKHLETESEFLETIKEGLWVVDFYADWCGPCKMLAPILEKQDFINVLKINVDQFQNISNQYGVMSIPTLIFFKNGIEAKKEIGFRNLEQIKQIVDSL